MRIPLVGITTAISRFGGLSFLVSAALTSARLYRFVQYTLSMPERRVYRATTAGRQARAGENVPRTARPGLVALPLALRLNDQLGGGVAWARTKVPIDPLEVARVLPCCPLGPSPSRTCRIQSRLFSQGRCSLRLEGLAEEL
jgi:hypothetical protein